MEAILKYQKLLNDYGYKLNKESTILDFGCGIGRNVIKFRSNGYNAYGCDIEINTEVNLDTFLMYQDGILRSIDNDNYRIPFNDNTFDFIVSEQVFEHIQDYRSALSELRRVLKPGGASLHKFPPRYIFIEPHLHVPLGTIIQTRWWLTIWGFMGIRNQYQKGKDYRSVVELNYNYLKDKTNYLTKYELKKLFSEYFYNVIFCERVAIKYSENYRCLYNIISKKFLIEDTTSKLFSAFCGRIVLLS